MLPGDNYSGAEMSDDDTDWSSVEGREGLPCPSPAEVRSPVTIKKKNVLIYCFPSRLISFDANEM